jgi:hypothetical protein
MRDLKSGIAENEQKEGKLGSPNEQREGELGS